MTKFLTLLVIPFFTFSVSRGQNDTTSKVVPKEFWDRSPVEAASLWAKTVYPEKDGFTWQKVEGVTVSQRGWFSYVGARNILGVSNQVVWFGENPRVLSISFKSPWEWGNSATENEPLFLLSEKPVGQEVRFLGLVTQELCNLERVADLESSSTGSFYLYNPPTIFDPLAIYGNKGELKYSEESAILGKNSWRKICVSGLLKNSMGKEVFSKDGGIDPWLDRGKRQNLCMELRAILEDSTIPTSFLKDVLRGVELYSLKELLPEVRKLSARFPESAAYVVQMRELEQKYGSILSPDEETKNEKGWHEFRKLTKRYWNDEVQHLRERCDETIYSLEASGDEKKIVDRIQSGKATDHLLYDFFRRDRQGYLNLLVARLAASKTAYNRSSLLRDLSKVGPERLLVYLEKCSEKEFIQCSAGAANLIREKRPELKEKLQKALGGYQEVVKDIGYWPLGGLEALVPEDDPRYFDDEAVKDAIQWWRKNAKIFTAQFVDEADFQSRIDSIESRWLVE